MSLPFTQVIVVLPKTLTSFSGVAEGEAIGVGVAKGVGVGDGVTTGVGEGVGVGTAFMREVN